MKENPAEGQYAEAVESVRGYYNSDDVRRIYDTSYGEEHLHLGIYENDEDTVDEAGQRTVERIASMIHELEPTTRVLDIGAGHGGSARFLFREYGCHVACLNLSDVQNTRNRDLNARDKCSLAINVVDGSFEDIPVTDESFDVVWSQDAILHSTRRRQVFAEVARVLCSGGQFIFTDPMQGESCPPEALQPILDRVHLDSLGSLRDYRAMASELGLQELEFADLTPHLATHYGRILEGLLANEQELTKQCGADHVQRVKTGLQHWVDGGKRGYLQWGILHFRKG
ncbi:MAG: methyltransferase domain-containing protein [Deltaproteobacteria bacterium]|nr:methyltransferase domain-containing protein [Deltaproteobacteria bacterium]